jgi:hypothetical protein
MEIHSTPVRTTLGPVAELDRLGDQIAELSAHLEAASARLLDLIREFDARGGWCNGSAPAPIGSVGGSTCPRCGPGESPRGARPSDAATLAEPPPGEPSHAKIRPDPRRHAEHPAAVS